MRSKINDKETEEPYDVFDTPLPVLDVGATGYAGFVEAHKLTFQERFALMLALVPHVKPESLDGFLTKNQNTQQIFTDFGGKRGKNHTGFLPTGETLMYLLAGGNLEKRFALQYLFEGDHLFAKEGILTLENVENGEPMLNGALTLSSEALDLFTTGAIRKPNFSADFPAKFLTTEMGWEDLVLNPYTSAQLTEIETWLKYRYTLMNDWDMHRKLKPGYKALFYGPPGTGKTLTASLLGKKIGSDVYRVDLSKVVSKYIGETEKNLSKVFDRAENKDWILFFDEADALFGKRTNVSDAHDRYANQEVSYLLQRIEDYNGLVILATNFKSNLDDAFTRRFQSIIQFPMPDVKERMLLWEKCFSPASKMEEGVKLEELARSYNLAGGSIINVVQYSSLMALDKGGNTIFLEDISEGVKREYHKQGRTL
ncbi:MAG: ATP-binding protein [Bacteroidota bacterium]